MRIFQVFRGHSRYIHKINELLQINGEPIKDFAEIADKIKNEADKMDNHPTEFEMITAAAFLYFYESCCDIVVLETGLGGRLDATNVIPAPEVAVITPISYDHTQFLGDTLEKIAAEKAGIIKQNIFVVSAPQEIEAANVLKNCCIEQEAEISFVNIQDIHIHENTIEGQRFSYKNFKELEISLLGHYQPQNAVLAITAVERLMKKGWTINETAIRKGLNKTIWSARFEIVHEFPWFIVDGGHNTQCVDTLLHNLNIYFPNKKISFLLGVMADKDYKTMFNKVLPLAEKIFTVTPNNPRAFDAKKLANYLRLQGFQKDNIKAFKSVQQGVRQIMNEANKDSVICAFGSLYMSGAIRKEFNLN